MGRCPRVRGAHDRSLRLGTLGTIESLVRHCTTNWHRGPQRESKGRSLQSTQPFVS